MKKSLLLTFIAVLFFTNSNAQNSLWQKVSQSKINNLPKMDRASIPSAYELYSLNFNALKTQLQNAPLASNNIQSNVIIAFPNSNGEIQNYRIYEAPVMEDGLSAKFPDIKSYSGTGVEDTTASIRFSTTLFGLHVMSLSGNSDTFYIDTYTKDLNNYIVYNRKNITNGRTFSCLIEDDAEAIASKNSPNVTLVNDGLFRVYRLAMACTIEYAAYHITAAGVGAGTLTERKGAVLAAMAITMTRVNGLYERDMSMRMNLINNNDLIIFVTSDNFTNDNAGNALLGESQSVIDSVIGSANYDIGHTVSTGGGGVATPGVCVSGIKGRGVTGSPAPVGDPYDIDFVAHEMGHQFGAEHTYNNSCSGNRQAGSAIEPGSGTTIMAYAGICAPNIQSNSDAYFHTISITQMTNFVLNTATCYADTFSGNTAPVVNAGPDYTIPNGTAFILKGSATDANGDALTYCWEQTNPQVSTQPPTRTATTGPNFRSRPPTSSPNRYMPVFSEVLAGNLAPTWEVIPTVARTMSFALTVRDNRTTNGSQTNRDNMVVTYASVGPFTITSPNVENVSWGLGSTQTITWNVAGTTGNNINAANVNILLSTDGGATFPIVLAANTANDGTQSVTMPSTAAPFCRIMIEAVGNIFYAVSKNVALGYTIATSCNTYTNSTPLVVPDASTTAAGPVVSNSISVPISGLISDVNIGLNVTHSFPQDLGIAINSPGNATQVVVWNGACAGNDNFNVTLSDGSPVFTCVANMTGTFAPSSPLAAFNGGNASGTWSLLTADFANTDSGTINSWFIEVCAQTLTLSAEDFGLDQFVLYPNPGNGNFNIRFNSASSNEIGIVVHDIRGREIFSRNYQNTGTFEQNVQLTSVQSGVYLVTVKDGNRKEVKKLIIE
jgi:subtilisin-like proprotein convertase family protein